MDTTLELIRTYNAFSGTGQTLEEDTVSALALDPVNLPDAPVDVDLPFLTSRA